MLQRSWVALACWLLGNRISERPDSIKAYFQRSIAACESSLHIPSENEVLAFRMLFPKCNEICVVEIVRGPFAFDGHRPVSPASKDEIDFVPTLISPIVNITVLRTSHNFIQYEMFP